MSTLFLDHKGIRIKREGRSLVLYQEGIRHGSIPLNLLDRVVVRANVELDTGLLGALGENGVGILIFGGRSGRRQASMGMPAGGDAARKVTQVRLHDSETWCNEFSRLIIRHKITGQKRLLCHALIRRPDRRYPLSRSIDTLEHTLGQTGGVERSSLLGLEGAAAASYFGAYKTLFASSLGFEGRRRRPPPDPVNACLSLAYTMIHFEAVSLLLAHGLDPYIGFYHRLSHGRESLACDLVEPLRPKVDQWVWTLFRSQALSTNHFQEASGAVKLGKAGRRIFYGEYESWVGLYRRALKRGIRYLLKVMLARNEACSAAEQEN